MGLILFSLELTSYSISSLLACNLSSPSFPRTVSVLIHENPPNPRQNVQVEDVSPRHLACSLALVSTPTPKYLLLHMEETWEPLV